MNSVTRHVEFEAAHLLAGYDGPCANLHGHTYKMEVTVAGHTVSEKSERFGFCIDFKELSTILKAVVPDHMFIADGRNLSGDTAEAGIVSVLDEWGLAYLALPFAPSAENMVKWFADEINLRLPEGIKVVNLKLWETTNSYAEWCSE